MTSRPFPPGGAELAREIMRGRCPDVVIYTGPNAFDLAENRRRNFGPGSALVIPPDRSPDDYRWPALERVEIVAPLMDSPARARIKSAITAACTRTASN